MARAVHSYFRKADYAPDQMEVKCDLAAFGSTGPQLAFLRRLHRAHRAFVAVRIRARPAAEIRGLPALMETTLCPFCFAQRAF